MNQELKIKDKSLFRVLLENNENGSVVTLNVQYRMHPILSEFPSRYIYQGGIENGVTSIQRYKPWHDTNLGVLRFFDNEESYHSTATNQSLANEDEAEDIACLVRHLIKHYKEQVLLY